MGDVVWIQCQKCGELHEAKARQPSEDDLYIELYCPKCKDSTSHLWIGTYRDEVYIYGNANLDPRIYEY